MSMPIVLQEVAYAFIYKSEKHKGTLWRIQNW